MTNRDYIVCLVLLLSVGLSFLFSGMESGVMALNRLRVRQGVRSGDARATVLQGFLNNPENFLWTILVGNTIANFLIFSLGALQLSELLGRYPVLICVSFAVAVFLFYIVCELLPKTLFQRSPTRLTLALARPFRFIHLALSPLVALVAWFASGGIRWTGGKTFTGQLFGGREELRLIMQESSPEMTTEEKMMINRVFDLQTFRVRHIAVPLARTMTVPADATMGMVLKFCQEHNFTRLPVVHPATGRIMGLLGMDELIYRSDLDKDKKASDYVQPALFLSGNLLVEEALHRMQLGGRRLAIVVGPNHKEMGIISLQDILKVIFGEVSA